MPEHQNVTHCIKSTDETRSLGNGTVMEAKTCEQYVLARLSDAMKENEALRSAIGELEGRLRDRDAREAESAGGEVTPREVQMYRINEPFETVYLTVADSYDLSDKKHGIGLSAKEAREKASTEEGLVEVSEMRVGWSESPAMRVNTSLWPFQVRTGTQTFALDLYNNGSNLSEARVCKDDEKADANKYFPSYRAEEIRRVGLETLKRNLLKYADKLDADAEKEVLDHE